MWKRLRFVIVGGILAGILLAVAVGVWWAHGPSQSTVRRTVITTLQSEAPESFLVTGALEIRATVKIDSAEYATPTWLTYAIGQTEPAVLSLLRGSSQTRVRVPGRVSYGFDVRSLTPQMIALESDGVVAVDLPELSVYSVEPDLARLKVRSDTKGWMRVFPSEVHEDVRERAMSGVRTAFEKQARAHIRSSTQPRVNTARAIEKILTPSLKAAGIDDPRFRIRIGDRLSLQPKSEEGETFRND